jgi:hypothetical protein
MLKEAISWRSDELAGRRAHRERGVREQAEVEASRWVVVLAGLGAAGVLVGFWGLVAWGLYTLFV